MDAQRRGALPEWIITIGGSLFTIALYVAAYWEPDIRWLHYLQSWMYIVAIALSWSGNSWGYFIGISAAALWNYFTLFVNTFFKNGLEQFDPAAERACSPTRSVHLGSRLGGNLLLIIGCPFAYQRLSQKHWTDVLTAGYLGQSV